MNTDIEIFYSDYAGNIIDLTKHKNKLNITNKNFDVIKINNNQIIKHCMKLIFVYENRSIIIFNETGGFNIFKKSDTNIFNLFNNRLNSETVKRIYYFWRLHCKFNIQDGI